ncbi:unnamed protein product [Caretta caretta]
MGLGPAPHSSLLAFATAPGDVCVCVQVLVKQLVSFLRKDYSHGVTREGRPRSLEDRRIVRALPEAPARPTLVQPGYIEKSAVQAAMPHFLDWFVPVYLMISILILVGFGACIYYFEPGLQEAHKWRTQRPIMERDLRKTLMIRDNLAFGVPEV